MIRTGKRFLNRGERGFTLVELLIVVIILAVLAAIVVPQFGSSTAEAKQSALQSTLTQMRNAIELYYHQHGAVYPGFNKAADGTASAAIDYAPSFIAQLTKYTEVSGKVSDTKTAAAKYGPYLKSASLPLNSIDDKNTLTPNDTGDLTAQGDGTTGGWWFDVKSGKFIANTNVGGTDYRTW